MNQPSLSCVPGKMNWVNLQALPKALTTVLSQSIRHEKQKKGLLDTEITTLLFYTAVCEHIMRYQDPVQHHPWITNKVRITNN